LHEPEYIQDAIRDIQKAFDAAAVLRKGSTVQESMKNGYPEIYCLQDGQKYWLNACDMSYNQQYEIKWN
jgi:hypothetical protein